MKLGAQFIEKSTANIYNYILTFSFCLILPKFQNHVFYINFVYTYLGYFFIK